MATNTQMPQSLWDSREVSQYLNNIPIGTRDQWAYRGVGPAYIKVGGRVVYTLEDVQRYELQQRYEAVV